MIRSTIAHEVVKIWEGSHENEVISIMLPQMTPKMIITGSYGIQANTYGTAMVESNLQEILGKLSGWIEDGYRCIWGGDVNLLLGAEHMDGNDVVISRTGKILNEFVSRYNLSIANSLVSDPTTHQDLCSGKCRALDIVVTNEIENIKNFKIDHDHHFTPFSIRYKKGKHTKIFSDHEAIQFDYVVQGGLTKINIPKPKRWTYSEDGNLKFQILTDSLFPWLLDIIENESDINTVVEKMKKVCLK